MFGKNKSEETAINPGNPQVQEDPIVQLLKKTEKQLRYTRITCIAVVAMAVMLFFVCVIIVPKAVDAIAQANDLMRDATAVMDNANTTLSGINEMSDEIKSAAEGINGLVADNADVLNDSMNKLNAIDFEGLNSAIKDLQAVVEPLANFFGKFGR